jgi:hypothetical protein
MATRTRPAALEATDGAEAGEAPETSSAEEAQASSNGKGKVVPLPRIPGLPRLELQLDNPIPAIERMLRRDEAELILLVGNVALVALEVIEWPVAVLTLAVHAIHRTRFKGLEALAEVVEEAE